MHSVVSGDGGPGRNGRYNAHTYLALALNLSVFADVMLLQIIYATIK